MIGPGPTVPAAPIHHLHQDFWSRSGLTSTPKGPDVNRSITARRGRNSFYFDAYHVGQGMCSLVHNGEFGVLLDVGAGKPVTRRAYRAKTLRNDIACDVAPLKKLLAVVSHADSDHWRILSWDSALRRKVDQIFVPSGAKSLAFRDTEVINKIAGIKSQTWHMTKAATLYLMRSDPAVKDSNGDCIVAVFKRQTTQILAAGDYVYARFAADKNTGIAALLKMAFSGVIVPHHGDSASGSSVVAAKPDAKAFFSAGTHQGYGHPTAASRTAHRKAGYLNVENQNLSDIVRVRLS